MGRAAARVLVVEDDKTVAEVVTRYLEREGFTVESVGDGRDALARADAQTPDLVVLDIMLPGLDGLEVCRRLRARAPVPVVMLTARGSEEDKVLGLELGADDYVSKPFSHASSRRAVKAVLRRAASPLDEIDRGEVLDYDGLRIDPEHVRRASMANSRPSRPASSTCSPSSPAGRGRSSAATSSSSMSGGTRTATPPL